MPRVPRDVLVYLYRWRAGAPQLLMRRRAPDRDGPQLDALDLEIRSVFREERLITPDDVRRRRLTLEESVRRHGWPALEDSRGKVAFLLDNDPGPIRDAYLAGRPNLEGRVLFTNSLAGRQDAASARSSKRRRRTRVSGPSRGVLTSSLRARRGVGRVVDHSPEGPATASTSLPVFAGIRVMTESGGWEALETSPTAFLFGGTVLAGARSPGLSLFLPCATTQRGGEGCEG